MGRCSPYPVSPLVIFITPQVWVVPCGRALRLLVEHLALARSHSPSLIKVGASSEVLEAWHLWIFKNFLYKWRDFTWCIFTIFCLVKLQDKDKKLGSFQKALLNCMAESVFFVDLAYSTGTMHALPLSMMLRKLVASCGKAWTWLKNSMPRTILKSSMGTIEKWSSPLYVPTVTCTPCAVPLVGLVGKFTAFMMPHFLVTLRPKHLASSSEIKLYVTPVSSSTRMA